MSIPSHVLLTTPMLTILFRRERDGRPATGGAELAKLVRSTKHDCESTNDWRQFFPGLVNRLTEAKYSLAEDFTAGHSYQVNYRKGEVTLAHSFAKQGDDLDKVAVNDIGNLKAFETWLSAHGPDSDLVVPIAVPALPAPAKPGTAEGKKALLAAAKAAVEAKQAKADAEKIARAEAKMNGGKARPAKRKTDEERLVGGVKHEVAKLTKEKKAHAAKVDKAVEAAHAAAERAAVTTRPPSEALAKAKALLRANLKPAVAAAV